MVCCVVLCRPHWLTLPLWPLPKYLLWLYTALRRLRRGAFMRWEEESSPCPLVTYMSSFTFNLVELICLSLSSGTGWPLQSLWPWALGERAEREVSERKNLTSTQQNRGYQCYHRCPQGFLQETTRATPHLPAQQSLHRSSRWDLMTQNVAVIVWHFCSRTC